MAFVTATQVNNALRLGLDVDNITDPNVADLLLKISQAQAIALDYLKVPDPIEKGWTDANHPLNIDSAIILIIRSLLDDTEESAAFLGGLQGKAEGDVRNPIVALLWRLRDPALA